ncbi:BgTH12-04521 [Blumeria graminis f. sp. triticale]|uniref:BgTH12-04521 n=1 Tax=Blumeria graminis f. sp. triticale TaxID=1689686 RepID=A0A9W4GC23_BLUGR|nr:BgTH12-04521 [Blumeria graminis f. sp. triticale]
MKFSIISGASTLYCILAPVQAFAILPAPLPVPDPDREFRFHCPNGPIYSKAQVTEKALTARAIMQFNRIDDDFPNVFTSLNYNIPGELWYYPMAEGPGPHDFVIFNTQTRIVGAVSRTHHGNGPDIIEPCQFA